MSEMAVLPTPASCYPTGLHQRLVIVIGEEKSGSDCLVSKDNRLALKIQCFQSTIDSLPYDHKIIEVGKNL